MGCTVLGASFDPPGANKAFAETEQFGFRLLSDESREVGRAYGVERPADDPYAAMPQRIAFLIDPAGVVRRRYVVKDVDGFATQVLDDLRELGVGSTA